jgi:hypothetical protein
MASKNTQFHKKDDMVSVKWVKKAQMWAKTTIIDNKQTIEWFSKNEKPSIVPQTETDAT